MKEPDMRLPFIGRSLAVTSVVLALALVWWPAGPGFASPASSATVQETPCSSEEFRQFDFWIGEWNVTAGDRSAGRNRITSTLGGCVLLEEYTATNGGYEGKSFNIYDSTAGEWHQSWVDNRGLLLQLRGGLEDGRMVLSGERIGQEGKPVIDRITWTPNEDGTVQQTWQVSGDDGETWSTAFDGTYVRVK
jgi:hypothetical protein